MMGAGAAYAAKAVVRPPAAVASEPKEIHLVHQLGPEREEALKQLVERFNERSKDYRLSVRTGTWSDDGSPHLMILPGEDMERFLAGKPRYKALSVVMREGGVPLPTLKPPAIMARALVDAKGLLLGLPGGLSTPVLYINRG